MFLAPQKLWQQDLLLKGKLPLVCLFLDPVIRLKASNHANTCQVPFHITQDFYKPCPILTPSPFFQTENSLFSHSLQGSYLLLTVLLSVFLWTFSTSVHFEMGEVLQLHMIIKLWTNSDFCLLSPAPVPCLTWTSFPFCSWCSGCGVKSDYWAGVFMKQIITQVPPSWKVMGSWSPKFLYWILPVGLTFI